MTGPDDFSLQILLEIKSKLEELTKTKKAMRGLRDETIDANKKIGGGFLDAQKNLRGMIQPITMVRRTIFQLGITWALTFGAAIAALLKTSAEMKEIRLLSLQTGLIFEDVSRKLYGFKISEENRKSFDELAYNWQLIQQSISGATVQLTVFTVQMSKLLAQKAQQSTWILDMLMPGAGFAMKNLPKPKQEDSQNRLTKDQFKLMDELKMKTMQFYGSKDVLMEYSHQLEMEQLMERAYKNKDLLTKIADWDTAYYEKKKQDSLITHQTIEADSLRTYGRITDAQKKEYYIQLMEFQKVHGANGEIMAIYEEFLRRKQELEQNARWGVKEFWKSQEDMVMNWKNSTSESLSSVFIDGLDSKLSNSKEIFRSYLVSLRNMLIKELISQAVFRTFLSMFGGSISSGGGVGIGGGKTTYGPNNVPSGFPPQSYQWGGSVENTGVAVVHKGEHISSPYSSETQGGGGNYNIYIQAVDAPSFVTMLNRNPEAIVSIVDRSIKNNQGHRRTVRSGR